MGDNMNFRPFIPALFAAVLWCGSCASLFAQALITAGAAPPDPKALQALVDSAVTATLGQFAAQKLQSNQLAVTLVDLRDLQHPVQASYRGEVQIYPASVVKLFYL